MNKTSLFFKILPTYMYWHPLKINTILCNWESMFALDSTVASSLRSKERSYITNTWAGMQSVHVVVKLIVTICTLIYENGNFLLNKVYELTHLQALRFNIIMPTVIEVFGFVFVSQALTCWAELGFEPVCSKFDYEIITGRPYWLRLAVTSWLWLKP